MPQDQEIEVKFYLRDLPRLEDRLREWNAYPIQPQVHETNLRFDTPNHELSSGKRVLRLRQDEHSHLTYKGPAQAGSEVSVRQEIEFEVSDFEAARRFLEALGYQVSVAYEKYRRTYSLEGMTVCLDEMPYGNFVELEGIDAEAIRVTAGVLGLNWDRRVTASYLEIFGKVKEKLPLKGTDLFFEAFEGIEVKPEDLELRYADEG